MSGSDRWAPAPDSLRAQRGRVDVWRAELTAAAGDYADLLSADERERPAHWGLTRGILRALLGRYLECDPTAVRFDTGPHGKPQLSESRVPLRFNVSHTHGIALYAVAFDRDVGVDVEREDRRADDVRVAGRIFGEAEADRLAALDPASRRHEFLRAWVRHEAIVKCIGTGIGAYRLEQPPADAPWVCELDVGVRVLGALAVSGGPCEVRCWEWPSALPA